MVKRKDIVATAALVAIFVLGSIFVQHRIAQGQGDTGVDARELPNLTVYGNTTLGRSATPTLTVNATSTFAGPTTISGNVTLSGTNTLSGATTVTGTLATTSTTTLGDASTDSVVLNGAVTTGANTPVTLSNTLGVTGATTFTGATTHNGAVTLGDATSDTLTVNGVFQGMKRSVNSVPSTQQAAATDDVIIVDTSGGAVTITLQAAATMIHKIYSIGRNTVAGTNAITIDPNGGELINAAATYAAMDASGDAVTIVSDGTEWIIIGSHIN